MQKISDNVLETIKTCKICPKPKWHFLMKNYVIWSAFFVAVVLGSLSFSAALHMLVSGDWDIYAYSGKSFFEFCLLVLPISWLLFLIVFAVLAFYNWKHTKHGYRYGTYAILLLSVGASGVFGFMLFNLGLGKKVDVMLSDSMPFYHKSKDDAVNALWMQPDRGLLSGQIVEVEDKKITIEDSDGNKWDVQITQETHKPDCCKKKGKNVRIIGKKGEKKEEIQSRDFVATEIRSDDEEDEDESENEKIKDEKEKREEEK